MVYLVVITTSALYINCKKYPNLVEINPNFSVEKYHIPFDLSW